MTDAQWISYKNNVIRYLRELIKTDDEDCIREQLRGYVAELKHDAASAKLTSKQQTKSGLSDGEAGMTDLQFSVMISLMAYDLGHAPKESTMEGMIDKVDKFISVLE